MSSVFPKIWAVVPIKSLDTAKSRLGGLLGAARPAFVAAMAQDVVRALDVSGVFGGIAVVTSDDRLRDELGAEKLYFVADEGGGLNGAARAGCRFAKSRGAAFCCVLPADLPLLTADDVAEVVQGAVRDAALAKSGLAGLVACKNGLGTNFLFLPAEAPLAFHFGPDSFRAHRRQAMARSLAVAVYRNEGLGFDVDTASDVAELEERVARGGRRAGPATAAFLREHARSRGGTSTAPDHDRVTAAEIRALGRSEPLEALMARAARLRDRYHGTTVTYSRKVFLPLTYLCRDVCHYCVFAKSPRQVDSLYMSVDDALAIARKGAAAGCREALFTLGEKPELRYRAARDWLSGQGFESTLHYVAHVAEAVVKETGLLPHINAGCMSGEEISFLRRVAPSMGLMLENVSERLCEKGQAHFGSPDKHPKVRLKTIEDAGRAKVPFTTGILIGIGETRDERLDSLFAIADLHRKYGHIQEVIIQNFVPKDATKMAAQPGAAMEDLRWTIAMARLILGGEMNIQAPPNLAKGDITSLIAAGINDWGGVSPVTPDHVNPESPWPHLDALAQATLDGGKDLVQRLTLYPDYAIAGRDWVDEAVRPFVLKAMDGAGYAREDDWLSGVSADVPQAYGGLSAARAAHPALRLTASYGVEEILARPNADWSVEDIARLFAARGRDFDAVCAAADQLRRQRKGDVVTYVVNRNINYTNICSYGCTFCAFSKGPRKSRGGDAPYNLSLGEIVDIARGAAERGATELCLQGGIHPHFTGQTYLDICSALHEALPDMHLHAFSPLEVTHGAQSLDLPVGSFLTRLKQAGLSTLPGTAAEILHDPVRDILCPDKLKTQAWLDVVRSAHAVGLPTTATIMFGHIDGYADWARHLLRVRALQIETGGITEFVPLGFVAHEAPLFRKGRARRGPTFREGVLMHAVGRLVLDPFIDNIQTSWVKMGVAGAQACLNAGANDMGGTLMSESITRAAGAVHGQEMTPGRLCQAIRAMGRVPHQRSTLYGKIDPHIADPHLEAEIAFL